MKMQEHDIVAQWQKAAIALAAITGAVLLAFFDTARTLVITWWDKPEYNHCLLILPIIVYLINERREVFKKIAPEPCWLGLLPILAGGMLWLLGELGDVNVVEQFGLIIVIQGCIITILGKRVALAFIFPLFYMVFLIPFGDFLVPMLQDFTTAFVIAILNMMDIPVFVQGVYLSIPAGDFHVAEACAGLRFLVATVALGTLMANVAYKTVGRQIIVVVLAFVVPVIANGFRASGIILIANWSNMKYATGADHITFGWIFFAIVLLIFISISMTFTNRKLDDHYIDFSKGYWTMNKAVSLKKFLPFLAGAFFVIIFAPLYVSIIEQRYQSYDTYHMSIEGKIAGEDNTKVSDWLPYYKGASQTFHLNQRQAGAGSIDIFAAYYKYQVGGSEMIQYGNGIDREEIWGRIGSKKIKANVGGINTSVIEVKLQSGRENRLVWYWYWVDGKIMTSNYKAKFFDAKAKLLGGRLDSAIMAVSVVVDEENIDQQRALLSNFTAHLPLLETLVTQ